MEQNVGADAGGDAAVRTVVDIDAVAAWMDTQELGSGPLQRLELMAGGTQNVLLRFWRDGREYVLRRPPTHKRSNSDETMRREARVLAGLSGSDIPHPQFIAACDDLEVLGAFFYLMEPVVGFTPTVSRPPFLDEPAAQREMSFAVVDALAALGRVDIEATGLHSLGRAEGWLERQVARWTKQLDSYAQFPEWSAEGLPDATALRAWLDANRPVVWSPGLIHGDYHFANVMISNDEPTVAAVVDWEPATVPDPLLDLGHLMATWCDDGGVANTATVLALPGLPTRAELAARYALGSERSLADIGWYHALACYRLAVLLEGTHARSTAGQASVESGRRMRAMAIALLEQGLALTSGPVSSGPMSSGH